jgi:hypothetical protein
MMFKSKHSGWTWDLKRTPFGRGGGGFISAITDPISSAIGTDGGGGGILGGLASIDPGPAIGSGLADVDKFVNNEIPGGWALPAAIAAAYATGYIDPTLFATEAAAAAGAEAGAGAIATEAGQAAFFDALAAGASSTEAVSAGLAADAALTGAGAAGVADAVTSTPGADAILNSPTQIANLTPPGAGNFGSIVAPLEGSGAIPGAGAITNAGGLTGAMPAGTMVGDGTLGTTIGKTYMSAAPGQFALDASGAAIPAGTSGISGTVPTTPSISLSDAEKAAKLAKALAGSQTTSAVQNLATGQTGVGSAIPALLRGNQNPFLQTAQQPIRSAQPMDLSSLAQLLKQG